MAIIFPQRFSFLTHCLCLAGILCEAFSHEISQIHLLQPFPSGLHMYTGGQVLRSWKSIGLKKVFSPPSLLSSWFTGINPIPSFLHRSWSFEVGLGTAETSPGLHHNYFFSVHAAHVMLMMSYSNFVSLVIILPPDPLRISSWKVY